LGKNNNNKAPGCLVASVTLSGSHELGIEKEEKCMKAHENQIIGREIN
jgi:hypothetical protein